MSKQTFDDNCPGCRPACIDLETGQPMPDDHPVMQAILTFWKTTSLEQRRAFHDVCCLNSRKPEDLKLVGELNQQMQAAVNASSN